MFAGAARACGTPTRGGCFAVAFSPGSDFCFLSGRPCSLFLTLSRFLLLWWLFLQLLPRSGCFPFLSRAVFAISFSSRMVSAPFVCRSCNCILRGVIVDGFPCRSCSHVEGPAILWLLGVLLLHPRSHGCRIASSLLSFLQLLPHPGQIPASSVVVFAIAFAIAAIVRRLRACRRRRHACRPAGIGGCGSLISRGDPETAASRARANLTSATLDPKRRLECLESC